MAVWLQFQAPQREFFLAINLWASQFPVAMWSFLTLLGEADVLFCLLSPLLLWRPQMMVAVIAAVPLGGLLSVTLKALFAAQRPGNLIDPSQFKLIGMLLGNASFPSGHTITAFAAAVAVVAVLATSKQTRHVGQSALKTSLCAVPILLLAGLVGLSRVAVGAHWPVDVLAGAACGWLAGLSGAWFSLRLPKIWQSAISQFVLGQLLLVTGLVLLFKKMAYPAGAWAVWLAVALSVLTVVLQFARTYRRLGRVAQAKNKFVD
jgi:membrane-associated phospholipid phosphatase